MKKKRNFKPIQLSEEERRRRAFGQLSNKPSPKLNDLNLQFKGQRSGLIRSGALPITSGQRKESSGGW